jgi:ABC-type transporter Mla subunit MlaD
MDKKYNNISKADELFDKLNDLIDAEIGKTDKQLANLDDLIVHLEDELANETDPIAKKELQEKLNDANKIQDRLLKKKDGLETDKKAMNDDMA